MGNDPIEHIERSRPVWRRERLTECGRFASDVALCLSPSDAEAKVGKLGIRRAALVLCSTCVDRRSIERVLPGSLTSMVTRESHGRGRTLLDEELAALTILVERHSPEFFSILDGLRSAESFADAKARRDRAACVNK